MSVSQQRRIIAVSSMVVFALGFISTIVQKKSYDDGARFFIGVGIAYTIVSIISDMGSELGAGFAILIMLAAVLREGNFVLDYFAKRSKGSIVQTHKKTTPTVKKGGKVVSGPPAGPQGPMGPGFQGAH